MIEFSYKSKESGITLNVYRHILFISLSKVINIEELGEIVSKAKEAQNILNNKFLYWGTIYGISANFKITDETIEQIKAAINDEGSVNRKALAIVYENEKLISSKIHDTLRSLPPDVESMTFDMLPPALSWVDEVLNNYASKMYFRK